MTLPPGPDPADAGDESLIPLEGPEPIHNPAVDGPGAIRDVGMSPSPLDAEPADDDLPLVVLDHDDDLAAPPLASALSDTAQSYLRSVGLTDPRTWAAFRLDAVTDADLARLHLPPGSRRPGGIWLPTCDPRQPGTITGLVRLTPAQNKHQCVGPAVGLAGPVDLDAQPRVVLTSTPLTALRLHQAGVRDVALVEEVAALAPLHAWFAGRSVVLAAHTHADLAELAAALGPVGAQATTVLLSMRTGTINPETRRLLGAADPVPVERPPLTPLLLTALHTYATERIAAGAATEALRAVEADCPDTVRLNRLGYLPIDYQQALSTVSRRAFHGLRLADAVIMPATDADGRIVDLLVVYTRMSRQRLAGCFDPPRGLLGAGVLAGADHLIVTDTFRWLARLNRQGYRNVLLLRGPADAVQNARRIAAAGVRSATVRCRRDGNAVAAALTAAGITATIEAGMITGDDWVAAESSPPVPATVQPAAVVAVPAQPPVVVAEEPPLATVTADAAAPLATAVLANPVPATEPLIGMGVNLVGFDQAQGVAHLEVGPIRYTVEIAEHGLPTRQVTARRGQAVHQDRINLDVTAQVARFATSAARRLGVDHQRVVAHLVDAWRQVREQEAARDLPPEVAVDPVERTQAEAMLRDPDLLGCIDRDLVALGWLGEAPTKGILYLTATSRLLPEPLWSVYRATAGATPWKSLGIIAALMPPEACIVFHRLTESVLRRADRSALMHKLLLIDRAETLRPEGAIALRCLREWGGVGWQQVAQAEGATSVGMIGDVRGPVAVLAAAAGDLDRRCRDGFLTVTVDDSPEQTARLLADQRQRHRQSGAGAAEVQAIIRRHQAMQRLLRPGRVVIPFSDRIAFPQASIRHRAEHAVFFDLIAASALLYQFQRTRDASGAIVAVEADFHQAVSLAGHLLGISPDGLSAAGGQLLQRLFATGTTTFVLADLGGLIPDWTAYTYRAAAEELVQMGYFTAVGGGQGRARRYTRVAQGSVGPRIALLPPGSAVDTTTTLRPFDTFRGDSKGSTPATAVG